MCRLEACGTNLSCIISFLMSFWIVADMYSSYLAPFYTDGFCFHKMPILRTLKDLIIIKEIQLNTEANFSGTKLPC